MNSNNKYETRWEFIFKYNDNIICQRYFNVKGFNNKSLKSYDIKDVIDEICDDIMYKVKMDSLDYMNDNIYKYYLKPDFDKTDSNDNFYFQLVIDGVTRFEKMMDAKYPKEVKTSVDIRSDIPEIISKLQNVLSSRDLTLA